MHVAAKEILNRLTDRPILRGDEIAVVASGWQKHIRMLLVPAALRMLVLNGSMSSP